MCKNCAIRLLTPCIAYRPTCASTGGKTDCAGRLGEAREEDRRVTLHDVMHVAQRVMRIPKIGKTWQNDVSLCTEECGVWISKAIQSTVWVNGGKVQSDASLRGVQIVRFCDKGGEECNGCVA